MTAVLDNLETKATLRKLAASDSHVLVWARLGDAGPFPLFDSPVPAADALVAVETTETTARGIGQSIRFTIRRDESGLGITHG